jgi:hypothetical protein
MINRKKKSVLIGILVAAAALILLLIGFYVILSSKIAIRNIFAYIILSAVLGVISAAFYYFKFMAAFWIFFVGEVIGFYQMYRGFFDGMDGWGDLVGIISLLTWILLAFITGLAINVCIYLFRKYVS